MSKRQRDGQAQGDSTSASERRGADPLAMLTLIGVVALLMIAFASWRDVARIEANLDQRMGQLEARLEDMADGINRMPTGAAPARRGPDPNRVYTVRTDGAPVRGKAGAPIVIAEFSDYQ